MFLSPSDIHQQKLKSRLGNYDREDVDRLLETITASYGQVWRERDRASSHAKELEQKLHDYEELERLLRDSVLTGQRAAEVVKAEASGKAETLIENARAKAAKIIADAERQREQLTSEIERLRSVERDVEANCRAILVGALEALGSKDAASPESRDATRERETAAFRS
jgi:cell division initiation protein